MIKVKCREYKGDLLNLAEVYAVYEGVQAISATYRLSIRIRADETVDLDNVQTHEIEVINAKTAD